MWINYVSKHSRDHAASEYVSCVKLDRERAEFIGNKQTNMHIYIETLNFIY